MIERIDYEAVEAAEAQIDAFILKRNREREDANRTEGLWAASEARRRRSRWRENLEAWLEHERHMERLHADLAAEHRAKANALSSEVVA